MLIKDKYNNCTLCPRGCEVDRTSGKVGVCNSTDKIRVARAALHYWEEPCISGINGSGTVFFTGCQLHCVYCQNIQISCGGVGIEISEERLSEIFLELQEKGANNINLVTPSHYTPGIISALKKAKLHGLTIPIVYNSGGYESRETIRMYDGLIDIYIPDLKTLNPVIAKRYYHAENYHQFATVAIQEMYRQVGKPKQQNGIMMRGVIIRHLALPNQLDDTFDVIDYVAEAYGNNVCLSLMSQYVPMGNLDAYPEINRRLSDEDYNRVVDYAWGCGLENCFVQDSTSSSIDFIPPFNGEGV